MPETVTAPSAPAPAPPAAPPAASPAPAPAPVTAPVVAKDAPPAAPVSDALKGLTLEQREQQVLAAQRAQAAREQQMRAKQREYEDLKAKAERYAKIESLKADPAALLKELNLDYAAITKAQIQSNADGVVKRADLEAMKKELNERFEADRKALEAARQQQAAEAAEREVRRLVTSVLSTPDADSKYEILKAIGPRLTGAPDVESIALDYMAFDHQQRVKAGEQNPKPISVEEALDRAEADAAKLFETLPPRDKFKRYAQKAAEAPKPVEPAASAAKPVDAPSVEAKAAPVPADGPPEILPGESWTSWTQRIREWELERKSKKA